MKAYRHLCLHLELTTIMFIEVKTVLKENYEENRTHTLDIVQCFCKSYSFCDKGAWPNTRGVFSVKRTKRPTS
jgi:hypothetical protein